VSRYQKGKNNLDFTEARDSERQWHQLGHMQVCTSHQTDNHASTPPLSFYRPDALPAAQPTVSKHWRHPYYNTYSDFWWRCNVLLYTHVAERWLSVVIFCMCCMGCLLHKTYCWVWVWTIGYFSSALLALFFWSDAYCVNNLILQSTGCGANCMESNNEQTHIFLAVSFKLYWHHSFYNDVLFTLLILGTLLGFCSEYFGTEGT